MEERKVDAQTFRFMDQEWAIWKCDTRFNNVLHIDDKPYLTKFLVWEYGEIAYQASGHRLDTTPNSVFGDISIVVHFSGKTLSPRTLSYSAYSEEESKVKVKINDEGVGDNGGFFEIMIQLKTSLEFNQNNYDFVVESTSIINNAQMIRQLLSYGGINRVVEAKHIQSHVNHAHKLDHLTQAIDNMSKAFHELIGKFVALERQQDIMQEEFSDFKSYMCTGKERECEELMGRIRAERDDRDGDL